MPAKLTPPQTKMMSNLASVITDGTRNDSQYWLNGKNVSVQVRSMLMNGFIAWEDGRLVEVVAPATPVAPAVDIKTVVNAMRDLLDGGRPRM